MKPRAYSYIRFSTKDQLRGNSLIRQAERAEKWCKANDVELVQTYKDLGVSAFRGKNAAIGQLAQFLKLVQTGRVPVGSYFVVENLDRLSRADILEADDLFKKLIRAGIKVVTLSDGQVYDRESIIKSPMQLTITLAVMVRAHDESERKSDLIASAWAAKRKRIAQEKMTSQCPSWLRLAPDRKAFEVIPERAAVVRQIFEMYAQGKGARQIQRVLQEQNAPIFNGGKTWHNSYIRRVLDNRAVIGEFVPKIRRDGQVKELDPVQGYFPAVVPPELFAAVQQIRREHTRIKGRTGTKNVFSKLAFDGKTDTPMTYVSASKRRYLVPLAARYGQADFSSWNYEDFKASFLAVCRRAALEKHEPIGADKGALVLARQQYADIEQQLSRLIDFQARGVVEDVEQRIRELARQKTILRDQIQTLENEATAKPKDVSEIDWADETALRENLCATVKRITVDCKARWFKAEFFDGRVYEARENKDKTVTITAPNRAEADAIKEAV